MLYSMQSKTCEGLKGIYNIKITGTPELFVKVTNIFRAYIKIFITSVANLHTYLKNCIFYLTVSEKYKFSVNQY